jgi:restriction system protein
MSELKTEYKYSFSLKVDNDNQANKYKDLFDEISKKLKEESNKNYFVIGEVFHTGYSYALEVEHEGLNISKTIKSKDSDTLTQNINSQLQKWAEEWMEQVIKNFMGDYDKQERNKENAMNNILKTAINKNIYLDWNKHYNNKEYDIKAPILTMQKNSNKPEIFDKTYQLKHNLLTLLFKKLKLKKQKEIKLKFDKDFLTWKKEKARIDLINDKIIKKHEIELDDWFKNKEEFYKEQKEHNDRIDNLKNNLSNGEEKSVIFYAEEIIKTLSDQFSKDKTIIQYDKDTHHLIIELSLISIENISNYKSYAFTKTKHELFLKTKNRKEVNEFYDKIMYSYIFAVIHCMLNSEIKELIEKITINGYVNSLDKRTGINFDACILTISIDKETVQKLDLNNIEPKTSFKYLKGVSAMGLYNVIPIAPIYSINKEDKRLIEGYEVVGNINDETNLAAMDWQDFENLIREVFEKEFTLTGGEVKVTQASRDGGVDAIAFDPDPIRGGKIVIQAKRYTNVVGVSAVRDLYGTVMNEGATKGILVTTSNYGPDAYSFASGKPLTLLNGSNLLHLLEKHGHRAKIDLIEAKKILNFQ